MGGEEEKEGEVVPHISTYPVFLVIFTPWWLNRLFRVPGEGISVAGFADE